MSNAMNPSEKIDQKFAGYNDWRSERCTRLREIINNTAPNLKEDFKWDTAVWTGRKMVLAVSGFKDHVKINFFKGAFLDAETGLFNSGLDSKEHRSINFAENDKIDESKVAGLIKKAVEYDQR